jgi:molybdopterin/thiamine biosynthesis adenylyltransferase
MNTKPQDRFMRSLGILTQSQLEKVNKTQVAVAGLGLGGSIFLNLVRLGFEKFHIADPDIFERTNINRQRLAQEENLGRRKDKCSQEEASRINPEVQIKTFSDGVRLDNLDEFLNGIDWVVDVVDVFALPEKLALHAEARKKKIPVISCATLGFSGSVVVFTSETASFAELTGMDPRAHFTENLEKFLCFIAPEIPAYMQNQLFSAMDRSTHIPFVVPGGEIAAAFCATEIVKNIIGAGQRVYAPTGIFTDAFALKTQLFEASYRARALPKVQRKKVA